MPDAPVIEPKIEPLPKEPQVNPGTPAPERQPIRRDEPTDEPPPPHRTCPLDQLKLPPKGLLRFKI